jgi:hypothetical protein
MMRTFRLGRASRKPRVGRTTAIEKWQIVREREHHVSETCLRNRGGVWEEIGILVSRRHVVAAAEGTTGDESPRVRREGGLLASACPS